MGVFLATFATRSYNEKMNQQGQPEAAQAAIADCDDELGMEEAQEYRQRVSKWVRGSLECMQDPMFWFFVWAANKSREPVRHVFNILSSYSKQMSARVRSPDSCPCPTSELPIVDFVTNRLDQIDEEFLRLRQEVPAWTRATVDKLRQMICWNAETAVDLKDLEIMATKMVLLNHASFKRRLYSLFSKKLVVVRYSIESFVFCVLLHFADKLCLLGACQPVQRGGHSECFGF